MSNLKPMPQRLGVLITGGTSGIGLATGIHFAKQGHDVLVCGRDQRRLQEANSHLKKAAQSYRLNLSTQSPETLSEVTAGEATSSKAVGGSQPVDSITAAVACDLAQPLQCAELATLAIQKLGRVDVLVNNAAMAPMCPFEDTAQDEFEKVIAVNLRAAWVLTQRIWSTMTARRSGVVINISSMAAIDPFTGFSLYGASKGWCETWTKALADEGLRKGIHVYSVRPGAVETPLLRRLMPDFPAEKCVSPEEVAETIFELATTENHPSGSIITVSKDPL